MWKSSSAELELPDVVLRLSASCPESPLALARECLVNQYRILIARSIYPQAEVSGAFWVLTANSAADQHNVAGTSGGLPQSASQVFGSELPSSAGQPSAPVAARAAARPKREAEEWLLFFLKQHMSFENGTKMHTYAYVYMYTCMCTYICRHTHTYIQSFMCVYIYTHL